MAELTHDNILQLQGIAIEQLAEMREMFDKDLPQLGAEIFLMCNEDRIPREQRKRWMEWVAKLTLFHAYITELCDAMNQLLNANIETVESIKRSGGSPQ